MRLRLLLAAAALATTLAHAQAPATPPPLYLGAAWYPEQWPESRWDNDLSLMEQAHIRFVRVGEFAWARMEPTEGHVDLDWLAHAVRLAEKHHIAVVLGTPGATPPAWLTQTYPDTLRINEDGSRDKHGNREQFDFTSPRYRELVGGITEKMAERFGHDPNVIGWQIDNEIAALSFGPDTQQQFHDWLRNHYKTLDNLNARWTTQYWSESYTDWSQVPIQTSYGNPGLLLSWKHFVSDTWRSYCDLHIAKIRPHSDRRQFITTNTMGWFDGYDHYTVEQDLDMAAWDDYVGTGHLDPDYNGAAHDLTRGFLRKNFWIMETQPGFVNWSKDNNALNKGEVRAMAWHDVGHGADAVSYWQWRSALNGQEQYHGVLVGADGTPVPLYPEVQQLGAEFAKAGPALAGTTVHSDVAILHSYDSRWAIDWQRHNQAFDPIQSLLSYYKPLRALVHNLDIVNPGVSLAQYKLVVAPALNVLTDEQAQNLMDYVKQGGHLVLGQRSAMKDADNTLQVNRQPGPLVPLLGGRVEQFYALEKDVPVVGDWGTGTSTIWAEQLSVLPAAAGASSSETKVLMTYGKSNGWLDNQPAAITRQVGKGSITYIGAWLDEATMKTAAKWMVSTSGIQTLPITLPPGVDLYIRSRPGDKGEHTVYILENLSATPADITLPSPMFNVLSGGTTSTVHLNQYDVTILSKN